MAGRPARGASGRWEARAGEAERRKQRREGGPRLGPAWARKEDERGGGGEAAALPASRHGRQREAGQPTAEELQEQRPRPGGSPCPPRPPRRPASASGRGAGQAWAAGGRARQAGGREEGGQGRRCGVSANLRGAWRSPRGAAWAALPASRRGGRGGPWLPGAVLGKRRRGGGRGGGGLGLLHRRRLGLPSSWADGKRHREEGGGGRRALSWPPRDLRLPLPETGRWGGSGWVGWRKEGRKERGALPVADGGAPSSPPTRLPATGAACRMTCGFSPPHPLASFYQARWLGLSALSALEAGLSRSHPVKPSGMLRT